MSHWQGVRPYKFLYDSHCVKAAKGEREGVKTLAARKV